MLRELAKFEGEVITMATYSYIVPLYELANFYCDTLTEALFL